MALAASKVLTAFLDAKGVKYEVDEDGIVKLRQSVENSNSTLIMLIVFDDDNHVRIEGGGFASIPQDKINGMYKVVNQLNDDYRWVKFVVNEAGEDIRVRVDTVVSLDTCADEIFELCLRMTAIVDKAYPVIMKGLWA